MFQIVILLNGKWLSINDKR